MSGISPRHRSSDGAPAAWPRLGVLGATAVLLMGALGACGSDSKSSSTAGLTATEKEFSIKLNLGSTKAGAVRLKVHNAGAALHELVAFRSDLDEEALPLVADGSKVDETGTGITHLDPEAENIAAGADNTISIDLTAGRYVLVCNLAGHYTQGMHAVLTVT